MAMTRAELNQAFREAVSLEFVEVPCVEASIEFDFSNDFQKKMEKLICRQKKAYWEYVNTSKKRAAIVAIVCLSAFVTACTNPEFREPIIRQMEKLEGTMRQYFIEGSMKQEIEVLYSLSNVPGGYQNVFEYSDSMRAIWIEDGYGMGLIYEGCSNVEVIIQMIETIAID